MPLGSGRSVTVTSRPSRETPATMALTSLNPMTGSSAVSAYVPVNAPIFPAAAAIPWLVVRTWTGKISAG